MNSGGWVVLMVIFTAFFFAFTVYRFGNISQTSLLGDSGNHLFFRRLRLVLFAGSGYVALVATLTIPEFQSGVLAIRMGGIVVVLIQVASMAKAYFELKQYESMIQMDIHLYSIRNFTRASSIDHVTTTSTVLYAESCIV